MQKRQILVVAVVLAGVSLVVSDEDVKPLDFYKYSLQWGPSACSSPPGGKKCEVRPEARFTIHGLWPQYYEDTPVPPYCDDLRCTNTKPTSANDVVKQLKESPFKVDLMSYWPDLYARQRRKEEDNLEFWKYEWRKHGMCSDFANNPSDYFKITLKLLLGRFKDLQKGNYLPYTMRFVSVIKKKKLSTAPIGSGWGVALAIPELPTSFLPGGAGGTDAVNYNFSHDGDSSLFTTLKRTPWWQNNKEASQAPKEDRKPILLIVKLEKGSSPLDRPSAISQGSLDVSEDALQSNLPHL
ncbi:ribonuclease 1-like [Gossypium australe]|uniref:Ribonuclease 1-like n=1 Tax=Gossypium australe TaxID=47621 RepID=A0A5B6WHF5_9ROSI|nr:ribonuclease 1-like [Gossypium australe]